MRKRFYDKARLFLESGKGGNGVVSFRREKYVPKGGPDGGDGGKGGDIIVFASDQCTNLNHLHFKNHHKAGDGQNGSGRSKCGANGNDISLEVPRGTLIKTKEGVVISELKKVGERQIVLKGGAGGRGNATFKSSTRQKPQEAEKGEKGISSEILLELKIIADIALMGAPNSGKSTLLAKLTGSSAKAGFYPFTTTTPQIGVYRFENEFLPRLTLVEIPGLIESASMGRGLGIEFLRHSQRASHFFFLHDTSEDNPVEKVEGIINEMCQYDNDVLKTKIDMRHFDIILTKTDLVSEEDVAKKKNQLSKHFSDINIITLNCMTKNGLSTIFSRMIELRQANSHISILEQKRQNVFQQLDKWLKENS